MAGQWGGEPSSREPRGPQGHGGNLNSVLSAGLGAWHIQVWGDWGTCPVCKALGKPAGQEVVVGHRGAAGQAMGAWEAPSCR